MEGIFQTVSLGSHTVSLHRILPTTLFTSATVLLGYIGFW